MKRFLFLFLSTALAVAQTGCQHSYDTGIVVSSKDGLPVNRTTSTTVVRHQAVPNGDIDGVRYGEIVKVYAANRYVDPTDPRTMHERHAVYRVEQDPQFVLNYHQLKLVGWGGTKSPWGGSKPLESPSPAAYLPVTTRNCPSPSSSHFCSSEPVELKTL